jgi:hypothetical protein
VSALVNDDNALFSPSQSASSLTQGILAGGTFRILHHLLQRTLTHIQTSQTSEMLGGDMLNHIGDPPDGVSVAA